MNQNTTLHLLRLFCNRNFLRNVWSLILRQPVRFFLADLFHFLKSGIVNVVHSSDFLIFRFFSIYHITRMNKQPIVFQPTSTQLLPHIAYDRIKHHPLHVFQDNGIVVMKASDLCSPLSVWRSIYIPSKIIKIVTEFRNRGSYLFRPAQLNICSSFLLLLGIIEPHISRQVKSLFILNNTTSEIF